MDETIYDPWCKVLNDQINQLELIASWASQVQEGACRDHCREAIADLRRSIERRQESLRSYQ